MIKKLTSTLGARWFHFVAIPATVLIWFWLTDPSGGADTALRLQLWAQAFLVTGIAYLVSKSMLGRASSQELYEDARDGSIGAGIAYLGTCLLRGMVLVGLLMFFAQLQR